MKVLITGGAGFIGVNAAEKYLLKKAKVIIVDNLSRPGTEYNLKFLRDLKKKFKFYRTDICDAKKLEDIFRRNRDVDIVYHLAAQVAVTTSVLDPGRDFAVNLSGTLNVLEGVRKYCPDAVVVFSSTNKVYGALENVILREEKLRYRLLKPKNGIPENWLLDFHSPYGCSKGGADQYVRDYSRIYGLKTIVFRQSCIYGRHQWGVEDQGWVAYFIKQVLLGKPITIYGNGKQVRDLLYVGDLISAYELAVKNIKKSAGRIYNIGGGKDNARSLLEFNQMIKNEFGQEVRCHFADWRSGDQKIFISDNSLLQAELGWKPRTDYSAGIRILYDWIKRYGVKK
jgi:CDP-paratose 2-epimerase